MKFVFDSLVFGTSRLPEIREFYEYKLGFPTGTFEKNGSTVPDYSDKYVNYHIGGGLIGFEQEDQISVGDLILKVSNFDELKQKILRASIPIIKENQYFFIIRDPDNRTLIFEALK